MATGFGNLDLQMAMKRSVSVELVEESPPETDSGGNVTTRCRGR